MEDELTFGRNLGDCEIHSISFSKEAAHFRLFDPHDTTFFTIVFNGVKHLRFETNHTQNVIDSMKIFDGIEEALKDAAVSRWLARFDSFGTNLPDKIAKVAHIRPIAGGETLVVFSHLEINS
jgi:hypothetical protein